MYHAACKFEHQPLNRSNSQHTTYLFMVCLKQDGTSTRLTRRVCLKGPFCQEKKNTAVFEKKKKSRFFYSCCNISGIMTYHASPPKTAYPHNYQASDCRPSNVYAVCDGLCLYRRCWGPWICMGGHPCCVCIMKRDCSAARIVNFLELLLGIFTNDVSV